MSKTKEANEMVARMQADLAALRARRIDTSMEETMLYLTLSQRLDRLYGALEVDAIEYPVQPPMEEDYADCFEQEVPINSRRGSKQ